VTIAHTSPVLSVEDIDAAEAMLRASGLRVSAARRLVLEALFATDVPVSAEEIAAGLGGRITRTDVGSVYRNLETLEKLGLVRHFHLGHGPGLYALAGAEAREYLHCDSCGATEAVDPVDLDAVRELVRRRFGFHARFTHFPIVGLCRACADGEPDVGSEQPTGGGP
jgi:Fur family ferric uptake transcriptional regulator